jgi:hypothetical protein
MVVGFERSGEGIVYCADVKRGGQEMYRIALCGSVSDEAAARKALSAKARIWIDEFRHREGQSDATADQPLVLRES